jgi:short-subunit dehydrogenase
MNKTHNKTVVWVTGASSGIGKGLVIEYFSKGFTIVASARNEKTLLDLRTELNGNEQNFIIAPFDLAQTENIKQLVEKVINQVQHVDILINVGGQSQRSLASETKMDVYKQIMEVNFFGTVALTNAILPYIIKQGGGKISATSSIVGKFGFPLRSAYSAAKHALHGYLETVRAENVNNNIKVSVIIPGRINTNISVNALTKEGNIYGKMDEGQANGMSVEKAASIIYKGIEKNKNEILVGGKELLMVHFRRFLPFLAYRMAAKVKAT